MNAEDILKRLVSFAPVNGKQNSEMVAYISEFLSESGMLVEMSPKDSDDPLSPMNIIAVMGPETQPSVIFSGHLDVVSPDEHSKHSGWWCYENDISKIPDTPEEWSSHPFECREVDDRIYARGSADMLGAIACLMEFSRKVDSSRLQYQVRFVFTCDEESDMASAKRICHAMPSLSQIPVGCIVMEPTEMKPVIAHKGVVAGTVTVKGRTAHVSRTDLSIDPLKPLVRAYRQLARLCERHIGLEGKDDGFVPNVTNYNVYKFSSIGEGRDTPAVAQFGFVIIYPPSNPPQKILNNMQKVICRINKELYQKDVSCGAQMTLDFEGVPYEIGNDHPFYRTVANSLCNSNVRKVSFLTEAGLYARAGIPTVIVGPGSILQAHVPDEYIEKRQLRMAAEFLAKLYGDFLSVPSDRPSVPGSRNDQPLLGARL